MNSLGRPTCQSEHPFKSPAPASHRFDHFYDSSPSADRHQERDDDLLSMHNRWEAQAKAESSVNVTELVKPTRSLVPESVAEVPSQRNSFFELPSLWFSELTKDKSQLQEDHEPHEKDYQITKNDSYSMYRGIFESLVPGWLRSVFEFSSATKDEGNLDDDVSSLSESSSSKTRVRNRSEYYNDRDIDVPLVITFVPNNGTPRSKANESSFFGCLPIPWRLGGDETSSATKSTSLADIGRTLLLPVIKQLGDIFNLKLDPSASTEKESGCTKEQKNVNETKHNDSRQCGSGEAVTTFQSPKNCGISDSELLYSFNSAQSGRRSMSGRQDSLQRRSSFDGQESSVFPDSRRSVKRRRSYTLLQRRTETRRSNTDSSASRRSLYERQGSIQSLVSKASRRDLHQRQRSCRSLGSQILPHVDELKMAQDHRSKWTSQSQRHRSIQSNQSRRKSNAQIILQDPINQTLRRRQSQRSYSLDPSRRSMCSKGMCTPQNASSRSLLSKHSQIARSPKRGDSEMKIDYEHQSRRTSPFERKRSRSLSYERQSPTYRCAITQQDASFQSLLSQIAKSPERNDFEMKIDHDQQSRRRSLYQCKRSKSLSYERQGPSYSWTSMDSHISPQIDDSEVKMDPLHQSRRKSRYKRQRSKSFSSSSVGRVTRRSLDSNAGCLRASVSTRQRQLEGARHSFIRSSSRRSLYQRQNSCPSFQSSTAAVRRLDDPTTQLISNRRNDHRRKAWRI